jgi:hypothetical protein
LDQFDSSAAADAERPTPNSETEEGKAATEIVGLHVQPIKRTISTMKTLMREAYKSWASGDVSQQEVIQFLTSLCEKESQLKHVLKSLNSSALRFILSMILY